MGAMKTTFGFGGAGWIAWMDWDWMVLEPDAVVVLDREVLPLSEADGCDSVDIPARIRPGRVQVFAGHA
jgi:hypothetical protein